MVGAVGGGALIATLSGCLGAVLPTVIVVAVALGAATYSLIWHVRDAKAFPGSRSGWQTNRKIAMTTRLGRVYFGGMLGIGVLTYMTTPLVYAMVLYSATVHLPTAVLAGVGFGLGRSRPTVTGLRASGRLSPAAVATRFANLTAFDRLAGSLIAAVIIASILVKVS